jgi:hypothetical protein
MCLRQRVLVLGERSSLAHPASFDTSDGRLISSLQARIVFEDGSMLMCARQCRTTVEVGAVPIPLYQMEDSSQVALATCRLVAGMRAHPFVETCARSNGLGLHPFLAMEALYRAGLACDLSTQDVLGRELSERGSRSAVLNREQRERVHAFARGLVATMEHFRNPDAQSVAYGRAFVQREHAAASDESTTKIRITSKNDEVWEIPVQANGVPVGYVPTRVWGVSVQIHDVQWQACSCTSYGEGCVREASPFTNPRTTRACQLLRARVPEVLAASSLDCFHRRREQRSDMFMQLAVTRAVAPRSRQSEVVRERQTPRTRQTTVARGTQRRTKRGTRRATRPNSATMRRAMGRATGRVMGRVMGRVTMRVMGRATAKEV